MRNATDLDLLNACIEGDRRAWPVFVQRFTRYVWFLIEATSKRYDAHLTPDDLADQHNDVFVALLEDDRRRLRQFQGKNGCSVRSWIRVITIRRTVDALRRRRAHLSLDALSGDAGGDTGRSLQLPDDGPDPLQAMMRAEDEQRRGQLHALMAQLGDQDRLLLDLLYQQKLPVEAAAAALRINRGALYTRKTRVIKRLRKLAADQGLVNSS